VPAGDWRRVSARTKPWRRLEGAVSYGCRLPERLEGEIGPFSLLLSVDRRW
jgi:hypothetical protein